MSVTMNFHSGVRPHANSTWRTPIRFPYLRQGTLDNSCGPYSVLTALTLLALVSRSDLAELNSTANLRLEHIWKWSKLGFFEGTSSADLMQMLRAVGNAIDVERMRGSTKKVIRTASLWWADGSVGLLALEPEGRAGHWITVVGNERTLTGKHSQTTALLCLDSAAGPSLLAPFNARLELHLTDESWEPLPYQTTDDVSPRLVRCREAIRISLTGEPLR